MMNVILGVRWLVAGALLASLSACSSTHVQSTRHAVGAGLPPFRQVTVAGMDERPMVREPFENDVVRLLDQRGVEGTASYSRYGFEELKGAKEQIRQKLNAAKDQSLLFVRVTGRTDFVDGPPASLGDLDMGAVDESRYVAFTTVGGDINTRYRLGARLYRVADGAVIWSATLDSVMKEDADSLVFIRDTAKALVERMARDKVIP